MGQIKLVCSILAAAACTFGGVLTVAPEAFAASTPVTFTTTSFSDANRTLSVDSASGKALGASTGLDTTQGPATFVTAVNDASSCDDQNFQVTATMSNLYQYDTTTKAWTCSNEIPSSAVTFGQPATPLSLQSIGVSVTNPQFTVDDSGLASVSGLLTLLGLASPPANSVVNGQALSSLSQSQLGLGSTPLTSGTSTSLPVTIASAPSAGAFSNADVAPSGSGCTGGGTGTTSFTVISGTSNSTGLLTNAIGPYLNGLDSGVLAGTMSAATAISDGLVSQSALLSAALPATVINLLNGIDSGELSTVLGAITVTFADTVGALTDISQSGYYGAVSTLSVSPGTAPAGTYEGTLTLTMLNTPAG